MHGQLALHIPDTHVPEAASGAVAVAAGKRAEDEAAAAMNARSARPTVRGVTRNKPDPLVFNGRPAALPWREPDAGLAFVLAQPSSEKLVLKGIAEARG
jgi:hypothetical protein